MTDETDTPTHDPMGPDEGTVRYDGPHGGWGSMEGMYKVLRETGGGPEATKTLLRQNKPGGFMCVSCAWTKPANPHPVEFCENGAKATFWEQTPKQCGPDFFAKHTISELKEWPDYELERVGRLTHPMRLDREADRYVPCSWDEAYQAIGTELKALDPKSTVFYASGRASLETSYLYALFARLYGHNNLPDSSNMCHETTSVALKKVIGSSVGTCVLEDFEHCDAIFFFGQNSGTNSPRFLHPLKAAVDRGCKIVTFNPVREKGLIEFVDPQNPIQMATRKPTQISSLYLQVRPGGDIAALMGLCKHLLDAEDERGDVLDRDFIEQHTNGFEEFEAAARGTSWEDIEREAGLTREMLKSAADVYLGAKNVIGIYGMGLTQHTHGWLNIAMFASFLMLRGNMGRKGAGISPVRGHSNVQGQRTVGISEKPELVPLDKLEAMFGFEAPREEGMNTVHACEGILDGKVRAFIGLGGNFVRAIPDIRRMEPAWERMRLTVQIATKLNRSHLINGEVAYLLPCLGRTEEDLQSGGPQVVTMEDSLSCVHGSVGKKRPASDSLRSEIAIVAGIAKATLPENPNVHWDAWTGDYGLVRDLIAKTYPDEFHDMSARMFTPGGFYRGNAVRDRVWKTDSGKAEFIVPNTLYSGKVPDAPGRYRLITMRSNDQFNTTIYGFSDRLRGIEGKRDVLFMNRDDIRRAGLVVGQRVDLVGDAEDGETREVCGLEVLPFDLPDGCLGAYYPEANPLVPLHLHDELSQTPAYKTVPVRIRAGNAA